ncbi:ubiquinone/menaquinone biosynthesis methyltransferase [Persephonella atlantica]|uniref:Ubiquinone/menaquinone biosynthesis methyltransferase n=1 Tax=Persephonella atlantica TaxID=2699429 RepID=A0ABS1GG08_9AQUI|nr:ubiquinone/menaquinone biosynthesis methyltransferase [Persephonella atlantica]MBK3331761.1 ubiquinone/menaquinone biosynthesis methyltransferase [Persephonella atlantica]
MDRSKLFRIINTFNKISDRYILANHILSFGQDVCWRKNLCQLVEKYTNRKGVILDVACGTGENFKYCPENFDKKIGIDPARNMLEIAKKQFPEVFFIEGIAEEIPLKNSSVDLITVSFGVRNFSDRKKAFSEFYRVLKKDGILAILEFFPMENGTLLNKIAAKYIYDFLPYLGGIITGNFKAYKYLSKSIKNFILPEVMKLELEKNGLTVLENSKTFPDVYTFIAKKS